MLFNEKRLILVDDPAWHMFATVYYVFVPSLAAVCLSVPGLYYAIRSKLSLNRALSSSCFQTYFFCAQCLTEV